jgi:hypothetical protein
MKRGKTYLTTIFPGHEFVVKKIVHNPFGDMVKLSCAPHCCTLPNFIEIMLPVREAVLIFKEGKRDSKEKIRMVDRLWEENAHDMSEHF